MDCAPNVPCAGKWVLDGGNNAPGPSHIVGANVRGCLVGYSEFMDLAKWGLVLCTKCGCYYTRSCPDDTHPGFRPEVPTLRPPPPAPTDDDLYDQWYLYGT